MWFILESLPAMPEDNLYEAADALIHGLKAIIPAADISYELKDRKETIRFLGNVISDFDNAYIKESDKRPLDAKGNPQLYAWPGARNIGE